MKLIPQSITTTHCTPFGKRLPFYGRAILFVGCLFSLATLLIQAKDASPEEPAQKSTYCRYISEKRGDFAWENDKVAFRVYGPLIKDPELDSGIDCWFKRVEYPIIDKWYRLAFEKVNSYHKDAGEGHDPYDVGASAGCGGTALWLDGHRVPLGRFVSQEIIESNTKRSEFVLYYQTTIDGIVYGESRRIAIELGEQLFEAESTFTKDGKLAVDLPVCIGVTTHDGKANTLSDEKKGWIACSESINGYWLGTAALMDPNRIDRIARVQSEKKDDSHIFILCKTDNTGAIRYRAGFSWERAGDITNEASWIDYLNTCASEKD